MEPLELRKVTVTLGVYLNIQAVPNRNRRATGKRRYADISQTYSTIDSESVILDLFGDRTAKGEFTDAMRAREPLRYASLQHLFRVTHVEGLYDYILAVFPDSIEIQDRVENHRLSIHVYPENQLEKQKIVMLIQSAIAREAAQAYEPVKSAAQGQSVANADLQMQMSG